MGSENWVTYPTFDASKEEIRLEIMKEMREGEQSGRSRLYTWGGRNMTTERQMRESLERLVDDKDGLIGSLEQRISRALDLLERHQWKHHSEDGPVSYLACIVCFRGRESGQTNGYICHKPDCELAQLLTENGREVRYA
jgi:hypothetical protein